MKIKTSNTVDKMVEVNSIIFDQTEEHVNTNDMPINCPQGEPVSDSIVVLDSTMETKPTCFMLC